MHVPTLNELKQNLDSRTLRLICYILINSKKSSYEYRSTKKVFYKLDFDKVLQYGYLLELADYCYSISRYFEDMLCKDLMKEVAVNIKKFAEGNQYFL